MSRLQLDVRNLSLGRRHLVNAYEVKGDIGVIAGNTVWSMPEHLECEVLQQERYVNTLPTSYRMAKLATISKSEESIHHLPSEGCCDFDFKRLGSSTTGKYLPSRSTISPCSLLSSVSCSLALDTCIQTANNFWRLLTQLHVSLRLLGILLRSRLITGWFLETYTQSNS